MRKRVEHDLDYIDNWSLGLDLQIMVPHRPASYRDRDARAIAWGRVKVTE